MSFPFVLVINFSKGIIFSFCFIFLNKLYKEIDFEKEKINTRDLILTYYLNRLNINSTVSFNLNSINTIRPRKRYNKWLKADKIEDLEVVKQYYNYNTEKAQQALRILTPENIHTIKERLNPGGLKNGT